uniref:Uncharacterized protein n=1 Tax=Rhizophora mucronata TaxID=61149 RepID=A0A2P2JQX0_RHIMU
MASSLLCFFRSREPVAMVPKSFCFFVGEEIEADFNCMTKTDSPQTSKQPSNRVYQRYKS